MPESTEINEVPPIPEWVSWNDEQMLDWARTHAATCDCCNEWQFVRVLRQSYLPSFIADNDELAQHDWATVAIHRSTVNDTDVLVRWDALDDGMFTGSFGRDVSYDALDEHYDYICEGCSEDRDEAERRAQSEQYDEDSSDYVHDYGYRPRTRFFTVFDGNVIAANTPMLSELGKRGVSSPASYEGIQPVQVPVCGFELEMTREDSRLSVDDAARKLYLIGENFSYMKWDGSVERGFELVTHPHTLEAYNAQVALWDALDELRHAGWRSWKSSSSCGLHIHINNASFTSLGHAMRFIMFIYKNREPLVRFAGRDSHYARFDFDQFVQREIHVGWNDDGTAIYEIGTVADVVKKKQVNDNRYLALNARNTHTYELRFFRGNLNPEAVRACLEFVYALHEYTQDLTSHDCLVNRALTWRPFLAFVRRKSGEENFRYRRLYDRLTIARRNGDNGFLNTGGAE